MREVDMSYKKIISLLDEADRELEEAEKSISDAESEIDNAKEIIVGIAEGMKNYQSPHLLLSTSPQKIVKNISALDYKQAIASYAGMSGIELDSPLTIMKNNTEIPNYAA